MDKTERIIEKVVWGSLFAMILFSLFVMLGCTKETTTMPRFEIEYSTDAEGDDGRAGTSGRIVIEPVPEEVVPVVTEVPRSTPTPAPMPEPVVPPVIDPDDPCGDPWNPCPPTNNPALPEPAPVDSPLWPPCPEWPDECTSPNPGPIPS